MCNKKYSVEAYLRDRWAQHAPFQWQDAREARFAARRRCVRSRTGSLSCRGTQHADPLAQSESESIFYYSIRVDFHSQKVNLT